MAGTTDFLQFNPSANNQENDASYLADTTRLNGLTDGIIADPTLHNKGFYQWSTFIAAFCQMMASKNFSTSDASISVLAAVLANILTTADIGFLTNILSLSYASTIVLDASVTWKWEIGPLTGNVTSVTLINTSPGQELVVHVVQDATGGRAWPWPSNMQGAGTVNPAPNAVTTQHFDVLAGGTIRASTPAMSN